jgi:hypothetical protein
MRIFSQRSFSVVDPLSAKSRFIGIFYLCTTLTYLQIKYPISPDQRMELHKSVAIILVDAYDLNQSILRQILKIPSLFSFIEPGMSFIEITRCLGNSE